MSKENANTGGASTVNEQDVKPTIGIITALPHEYTAVKVLLESQRPISVAGRGAGRQYLYGEVPAFNGNRHQIVLALLPDTGNNQASARAALLLEHFPSVNTIIMSGIAGGVPYPDKPAEHVRLGDIVVSGREGVVQYDFGKEELEDGRAKITPRHPPRPPSASLVETARLLQAGELEGERPWVRHINRGVDRLSTARPSDETDILVSSIDPDEVIIHPNDPMRVKDLPRVFLGPIASSNTLLKNPLKREQLRDSFGVKAVEMEGSGIADAAWTVEVQYLVVRGVCDYCDRNKGDNWQVYAAVVAAAYTRALLEATPSEPMLNPHKASQRSPSELLQSYHKRLLDKVAHVRLFGTNNIYELDRCFVELTVTTHDRPIGYDNFLGLIDVQQRRQRTLFSREIDNEFTPHLEKKHIQVRRRVKPDELLQNGTKAIITGAPGCGKTTLFRYLCGQTLRQFSASKIERPQGRWTVFLELKAISAEDFLNAKGRLEQLAYAKGVAAILDVDQHESTLLKEQFFSALREGRVCIFLDGLDEITGTGFFTDVCRMIGEFASSSHANNTFLISTRPYFLHQTRLQGLEEMEIEPFSDQQIVEFLQRYFPREAATQKLLAALDQHNGWREMARVPVLLASLYELYSQLELSADATRLDLYREITQRLSKKFDNEKPLTRKWHVAEDVEGALKLDFLQFLASERLLFEDYERFADRFIFSAEYILEKAEQFVEHKRMGGIVAYGLAADVKATPLLREVGTDVYAFSHLTLQEYLAARALAKRRDCERLFCQKFFDPILLGCETLPMVIGLVQKPDDLFAALERLPESLDFANFRLQVRGLGYVKRISNAHLNRLIDVLLEFIRGDNEENAPYANAIIKSFTTISSHLRQTIIYQLINCAHTAANIDMRGRILKALALMRAAEAIPEILAYLRNKHVGWWMRDSVAEALRKMQATGAIPEILAFLRDRQADLKARWIVTETFGLMRLNEAIPELLAFIRDQDAHSNLRRMVAEALGIMGSSKAIPELMAILRDNQIDLGVRESIAISLGQAGATEAIPELLSILRSDMAYSMEHGGIIRALGLLHVTEAIPELITLLCNKHVGWKVRETVPGALAQLGAREAIGVFLTLLRDEQVDSRVRHSVAGGLVRMGARETIPELLGLLLDKQVDTSVREEAAFVLGGMRATEAIPGLVTLLRDKKIHSNVRSRAAYALAKIGEKETTPELIALLHDRQIIYRALEEVVNTLGQMRATEAITELLALLWDKQAHPTVRGRAAYALVEIGGKEALLEVLPLLRDRHETQAVRANLAETLGRMRITEAIPELLAAFHTDLIWFVVSALEQISTDNESELTKGICKSLFSETPSTRRLAVRTIGYYDMGKETLLKLSRLAELDNDTDVRKTAAIAKEKFARKLELFDISITGSLHQNG